MQNRKTLQHFVTKSWLLSGAVALVASLFLFLVIGYYNYWREVSRTKEDLDSKTQVIARRLSGELLIAPRGAPDAVALQLSKELGIYEVTYGTPTKISHPRDTNNLIYSVLPIPFLENKYEVKTSVFKPSLLTSFNFSILFVSILIIGLTVGVGLFLQTRFLRRHLIRPIEALVDTSTGEKNISENWPLEIQEISLKLSSSFQEREKAVFSQIARGVIHDAKTILQSIKVATDLATESKTEGRLNNLLKVSQAKLPTLLELIDTTLDGSREITINSKQTSLNETIGRSIETVRGLNISDNKIIDMSIPEEISVSHDPIQLERVFTNLFKNSLEAISVKGESYGKLKVSFNLDDKDFICVAVEDNGMGLPQTPDSVFRLLKSTKPHGSGLGLLVSKKIVEAHGGKILAGKSEKLNGAKFEVLLPKGELV